MVNTNYQNGKPKDELTMYNPNGTIVQKIIYSEGLMLEKIKYKPDGTIGKVIDCKFEDCN